MAAQGNPAVLSRRRLVIITGPFGSGKTEIALGYALASAAAGRATALVDLDIVNPYFRAQDHRAELERGGVRVVCPEEPLSRYELPALSPQVRPVLAGRWRSRPIRQAQGRPGCEIHHLAGETCPEPAERTPAPPYHVVADVGGDPVGARILGSFRSQLDPGALELWLVINPWRPAAVEGELPALLRDIQREAGLDAGAVISNPNLGAETTPQDIREGHARVAAFATQMSKPVRFLAVDERLAKEVADPGIPVWPLRLRVRPPWGE
jgi:hypothetical protein